MRARSLSLRTLAALALLLSATLARAAPVSRSLTELSVSLYGMSAGVEPASPIVPKQTAAGVRVVVKAGGRTLPATEVARLLGGPFELQAELSGPGLAGALALPRTGADAIPSPDPLVLTFPGLPHAGEYELANIRLVRGGRAVLDVLPRRVTLRVIEQILVTSVATRPLSLDEIRERGVVLDASAYLGFEFAVTLKLESTPVQFRFPAVFDRQGVPIPIPLAPPPEPLRSVVSVPQLVPVLLRPAAAEGDPDGAPPDYGLDDLPGAGPARIPSLLVIPGSVGYLKQFFSAQLLVGNGAPAGAGLVVRDVTGTLRLPPGADGQPGTADDPLALPELESGPQSRTLAIRTEQGSAELGPGEFGRAELVLRGELEGRHDVDFDIRAELDGLPVGPVPLEGGAHGVVLVRNAYFDVTFTLPTVVRADEEFSVFATVTNIGQGTGNDVKMTLDGSRLSGARLLSAPTQTIASLVPGDAATLEYRFRSEVTGEVVASYLRFDTAGGVDVTGRLNFTLGVGERKVTLSPDTLVLPSAVRALPADVVRAAMRVLGQAWSAATASSVPPGVERPSTEAVFRKGLSVAEAALRVELGQPLAAALRDLLIDLHGDGLDPGFDQVLRETTAGADLDRVLGASLAAAAAADALQYEEDAARVAASGAPFLSAALVGPGGSAPQAELVVRDGQGRAAGASARELPGAVVAALGASAHAPRLAWLASLGAPPYTIELRGTGDGVVGLSLTLPDDAGGARHARVEGITVALGSRHRLVYDPARAGELRLSADLAGDGVFETESPVTLAPLASEGPRLVSAVTIGPETLDGASPFGTYAALLFDRVVSAADAAAVEHYEIAENAVLAAQRQLSGRIVFVALEQPEGPLVPARLAISGIRDERGAGGERQEQALGSRLLLPGAVVSGRVLQADGTPVEAAVVTYMNTSSGRGDGPWDCTTNFESGIAAQRTDASGRFGFRYVAQNACGGPFRLQTTDPTTGAVRGVKSYVRVNGQRLSLDLVLIGHGRVEGQVSHAVGGPAAGARVRVVSVTDSQIGVVTTTDASGHYAVEGMTVGAVTVTAVLGANLGRGAGRLDVAGGSTTVNVTLDGNVDITGVVRKLEDGVLTPVPGVDVVYYVGATPLGVSVSDSFGNYKLLGVPAGPYRLDAGLNQRDRTSLVGNSVAGQKLVQNLVIEVKDYSSYGTVTGTVRRLDGSPVPDAWVSDNVVAARADALGHYELAGVALSASPRSIQAVSPDGRRSGTTSVLLSVPGQVAAGVDIQLSGLGAAAFQVLDAQGAAVAGASVGLQGNCLHPCGCRFATTDTQGIARFADLSFGPVSARAVVQGVPGRWDTATGSATVSSEEVAGGGVIRMSGYGRVSGVVTNPNGQGAHGASVELTGQRVVIGGGSCGLSTSVLGTVATDASGQFSLEDVHVGPVSARASSVAFPRTVGASASIAADGGVARLELQLLDTMAGALSGTVFMPDGLSGAGPDVEVTASGSISDVTVRTDAQGHYSFAQVLPAGGYLLTARDSRPGGTGAVVQARVWLQPAQAASHDLRLKGKGPVRVTVVDGAGVVVEDAVVRVKLVESDFPYRSYEGTISGPGQQPFEFPEVFEGAFSVTASDNFARGGRAGSSVPPLGEPVEIRVQLTTVGRVAGRFLWADRVTPLPLGSVTLFAGGRMIGQQTTASEGEIGSFAFDFVPAGAVRLEAQDPRSGRTGVATGTLATQGQLLSLDVVAYAVGRVEGDVRLNGEPAPGAEVDLRSGQYHVRVTADGAGGYAVDGVPEGQVYATADLGGGFLAGSAQGALSGEGTTLQLPISLRGAGTIAGRLLAAGGGEAGAVSLVTLQGAGRSQTTTTDALGNFRFELVPEGSLTLLANALASIDCARESLTIEGGETATPTLTLRGVGSVEGAARDSSGPVAGSLSVSGTGPGCQPATWYLNVGPSGQFRIPEVIAGPVSASFSTRAPGGPWLRAVDADAVAPGATATLDLLVEPSGGVRGRVVHEDGTPAIGSQVRVEAASSGRVALVQTGGDGTFLAEGVPAGPVTIRVADAAHGGVALVTGLAVADNATLEAGEIRLLEVPLAVVSFSPADGTSQVGVTEPLQIAFNAPVALLGGVSIRVPGRTLGFGAAVAADPRVLVLTPAGAWPDSVEVTVEAGPWVADVYGRRLGVAYVSRFRTVDLSPPRVLAVTPAHGAIQVDVGATVAVRFDETLDTSVDLSGVVRLSSTQGPVPGTVAPSAPDTLVFTPAAPLQPNLVHTVTVNGARDLLGHVQTTAWSSSFITPDGDLPLLRLDSPPAGGWTKQARPTIRVVVADALAGPDTSRAQMQIDGRAASLTRGVDHFSHVPAADLADGAHTVTASAHDRAGNRGDLVASFSVDTQPPTAASLTAPAADQVLAGVVSLSATASDAASGIARISYLRDGQWIADAPAASGFTASWNTAASAEGSHLVTAQAVDVAGNSGPASPPVRVVVNNRPLTIAFTSPAAGFPVKTQVAVSASPSEPVRHVEFRAGSQPPVIDEQAPYEAVFDVTSEPEGELALSATAQGLAPETATATLAILVDRTPPPAPDPTRVHAEAHGASALVVGLADAVERQSRVEVQNPGRAAQNGRASFADGSFAMRVAGASGETVAVYAIDVAGNRSDPLALTLAEGDSGADDVPLGGLSLWAGPGGATVDTASRVARWAGQGPNELAQTTPSSKPVLAKDPVSGFEVVRFDGKDDALKLASRLSGTIRTVFAVVREDADAGGVGRALLGDVSKADFYGAASSWWYFINGPYAQTSPSIVNGQTWLDGAVIDGTRTARPKTLSVVSVQTTAGVTADRLGGAMFGQWWKGDVAELLLYEEPLDDAARKTVEDYLALKYAAYVATAGAPRISPNGATFADAVTVSLTTPTPGAVVRYTTDGTTPTATSPLYTGPFELLATTTVRARAFRGGMKPSRVALASFTKASDFAPPAVPGLALWARADAGVSADAVGRVSVWSDQSGRGNDLVQPTPGRQPVLQPDAANGFPLLRFDGVDDVLPFTTRLDATIRAVFAVVSEDQDAGAVGRSLLGDASSYDFFGGAGSWWYRINGPYVQTSPSVVNGQTWVNGTVVDGTTTPRPKTLSVLSVLTTGGVSADRLSMEAFSHRWKGQVAELVVYTDPLSNAQRKAVEDYLALKYAAYLPTAGTPAFTPEGGTFAEPVEVAITTPTPGAEIRYTTDGSDPLSSSTLYGGPFVVTTTTTVRARAFRAGMNPSPVALASFTSADDFSPASVPGLALWVGGDAGIERDAAERVTAWRDRSGKGNHLVQPTPGQQPLFDPAGANGLPALRFDGVNDVLPFTSRMDATIRAVFAVVAEDPDAGVAGRSLLGDASTYDFYGGAVNWWYRINGPYLQTSPYIVNGETWVNGAVVDGTATPRPKTLSALSVLTTAGVSADRLSMEALSHRWKGRVAELVVYTAPITQAQRKAVEDHLALKYAAYVPTAGTPELTPNGATFSDSVEVTITSPTPGAEIRYTTDEGEPGPGSALYGGPLVLTATTTLKARAFRDGTNPSPVAVATFTKRDELPPATIPGLALWVSADAGVERDAAQRVAAWRDRSSLANDLVQPTPGRQPLFEPTGANGLPALRFDGVDDVLPFTTRLGATIRAVFAVVSEDQDAGTGGRSLLGDATSYDFYAGGANWWYRINGPYVQTSAHILNGQTWLNGAPIDGTTTPRAKTLSVLSVVTTGGVSADRLSMEALGQRWKGRVAELVVYTGPITQQQRKAVEDYLALKYGAYLPRAGAPEFSPNGGTFDGAVEVRLASPTFGAEVRYTTDGSDPLAGSPLYDGPFTLTTTTTVRARAFRAGMDPSPVAVATFTEAAAATPRRISGLALWVSGDSGLEQDAAGRVGAWRDQSGAGNHLVQSASGQQPLVVPVGASGLPAASFDGQNDVLRFTTRLDRSIRAVFAVLRESATAGTASRGLLGDASAYDFYGSGTRWWYRINGPYLQTSAYILNGQTRVNGSLIDGTLTDRPRTLSVFSLVTTGGVSADRLSMEALSQWWKGEVAELIVYTEPLSDSQRQAVEGYLALKYGTYSAAAPTPTFTPPGSLFEDSQEVRIEVPPLPGTEVRYTTDGSDPTLASELYDAPLVLTATATLRARAFHPALQPSAVAAAAFTRTPYLTPGVASGLLLWARADAGIAPEAGDRVAVWRDASGRGNHLTQATAAAQPALVADVQAGLPVVRFDGGDTLLFQSRLTNIRTVFWVAREEASAPNGYRFLLGDATSYDFHSGAARQLWSSYTNAAILSGETRINGVAVDGLVASRPAALSIVSLVTTGNVTADAFSRDRTNNRSWWGDLAELIVYDRPLTGVEREEVEHYLALKYALYVPTLSAPIVSPSGSAGTAAVEATITAAPGAEVRYTLDGSVPTELSALYDEPLRITTRTTLKARAFRAGFNPSPVATAEFLDETTPAPLRVPGLKLWVKADAGVAVAGASVSAWTDQSGSGNHLVQATAASQPQLVPGGLNGLPVVRFDGAGDFMSFTTRLTTIRSVFWVIRRSPSMSSGYRFLLGDPTSYHFCSDATTKLWSSAYTSPAILNGETRLNGAVVSGVTTDRPASFSLLSVVTTGDVSATTFSKDRSYDYSWWGDLAELLIFDRPLAEGERLSIEGYLAEKYALFVPTTAAPWISPNGGSLAGPQVVQMGSDTAGATVRYTLDDSEPDETSPAYTEPFEVSGDVRIRARAFRPGWNPSAETVVTFHGPGAFTPASVSGLALWVRADAGVSADGSLWKNQAGGNDLFQATTTLRPSLVYDAGSRMPLLRFDGAGDNLFFTQRLSGIRTVFWVIRRAAAMTPGYRFLLGDATGYDFCSDAGTKLWTTSYTHAAILNGQTRLNGAAVNGTTTDRPAALSVLSLVTTANVAADAVSRDRSYGRSWWGDLAELVIYERALSAAEVTQVEAYLAGRYGIGLQP